RLDVVPRARGILRAVDQRGTGGALGIGMECVLALTRIAPLPAPRKLVGEELPRPGEATVEALRARLARAPGSVHATAEVVSAQIDEARVAGGSRDPGLPDQDRRVLRAVQIHVEAMAPGLAVVVAVEDRRSLVAPADALRHHRAVLVVVIEQAVRRVV